MTDPWIKGSGRGSYLCVASRLDLVARMGTEELQAAIAWPNTQKTVQHAAERRLRRLQREAKRQQTKET